MSTNGGFDVNQNDGLLILSLRPRFADMILSGHKTVELRRTRPAQAGRGSRVLLYVASPQRHLVGVCSVGEIDEGSPVELWKRVGDDAGVNRAEFLEYFDGARRAVAIELRSVRALPSPVKLRDLRSRWHGFQPPQSFRYMAPATARRLPALRGLS